MFQSSFQSAYTQVATTILNFLPLLAGAILILLVGLVISDWVKKLVEQFLKIARIPQLSQKLGLEHFLKQADISLSTVQILGQFSKWLVILVFLMASANLLNLTAISQILDRFLLFLPNLLIAALIFVAGLLIANFTESLTKGLVSALDSHLKAPIARLTRYLVIVFFALTAISQLHIAEALITTFFQGLTLTLTLAIGLSVGLGSKDLVAKLLNQWYKNLQKK
jgi:hypothetical protein